MKKKFFVTATDTDAGKTYVSVGLLKAAHRAGLRSLGLKPIAAGAELVNGKLCNDDALLIQDASSVFLPYEQVNPMVLEAPMAPHIAAAKENRLLSVSRIEGYLKGALLTPHDIAIVEGAGGWRVPINDRELLSDLAKCLNFPVVLVVNMKLGCINHALLTAEAIRHDGLTIAGWIANGGQDTMMCYEENLLTLTKMLPAPLLGTLLWHNCVSDAELEFDHIFSKL
ncbi:MAG: dethiobiotin synthase [Marinomonas sp.]